MPIPVVPDELVVLVVPVAVPVGQSRLARFSQAGQATAEYALVLLGVAAIALLVTAWAAKSCKIGDLFDAVIDQLIAKVR